MAKMRCASSQTAGNGMSSGFRGSTVGVPVSLGVGLSELVGSGDSVAVGEGVTEGPAVGEGVFVRGRGVSVALSPSQATCKRSTAVASSAGRAIQRISPAW